MLKKALGIMSGLSVKNVCLVAAACRRFRVRRSPNSAGAQRVGSGERTSSEEELKFSDFREAQAFVNRVGELAEEQGHHPDICFGWGNGGDLDLDSQDRRTDGKRFHPRGKDRQVVSHR